MTVAEKLNSLFEKSGHFDYLFLFGSFDDVSQDSLRKLEGTIYTPIFIFIVYLGCKKFMIGTESDGFMKLTTNSIVTLEDGLQIALCLSSEKSSNENLAGTVDILLTDLPPQSIEGSQSSASVRNVLSGLQPRYHITSFEGSRFFEQEPYENRDASGAFIFPTRLLSLAPALSTEKVSILFVTICV